MFFVKMWSIFWTVVFSIVHHEANYQCGIRKHSCVNLVAGGWKVEDGEWPWHVGLYKKTENGTHRYRCGGTLIDRKHVLTAAHCVIIRNSNRSMTIEELVLHFGQTDRSTMAKHVQVRDVAKIVVHPNINPQRNDIALLELRLPVEYTEHVIPICLDTRVRNDLRDVEDRRGWIAGWGATDNDTLSNELQTASLPVVGYLQCVQNDPILFGRLVDEKVFCSGDLNGTTPGTGDSGGGMYFSDGDRWVLRGIVSFAKIKKNWGKVDGSKYVVFVNVQSFLGWIQEATKDNSTEIVKRRVKRISERECKRFKKLSATSKGGKCFNSRYPHTVSLVFSEHTEGCTGVLVNENHVLTTCSCARGFVYILPQTVIANSTEENLGSATMVRIVDYGTVNISKIVCHSVYTNKKKTKQDIAIVKLKSLVKLSSRVIPACLANIWNENLYDTLLATGFKIIFNKDASGLTQHSKYFFETHDNQLVSTELCNGTFSLSSRKHGIHPSYLCQLNSRGRGSGGSPLQTFNTKTCMYTVVGVSSGLYRTFRNNKDGKVKVKYYYRVSHILDWIEKEVWGVRAVHKTTTETLEGPTTSRTFAEATTKETLTEMITVSPR